jgi:ribosomal-protein-alanine N-acetyltransferase
MKLITETERLVIREIEESDAPFMNELLNSPGFLKYIGDRGVRSDEDARAFIRDRYRKSYTDNGYGLYAVLLKADSTLIGMCGFVRRDSLPGPDLGFAFLPGFEGNGFGTESSRAMLAYGRETLNFERVYAITTLDNRASISLLEKLGFQFEKTVESPEGETLRFFAIDIA